MFSDLACSTFRKVFLASAFGVGVFLIPNGAQSSTSNSATLQWAANQESDLAGYRVYHGTTSGNYGSSQNAGMTTTYQFVNLESNKTHYFSTTAYDTSGNESSPSLEVFKTILSSPPPPPNPSPNPSPNPAPNPSPNPAPKPSPKPTPKPKFNPPPIPGFPMFVNFQPSSAEVPSNFIKDDGKVFNSTLGYGWDVLVKGRERNGKVDQTIDTFVQTSNKTSAAWNYTLPNGTYYLSMVMGDPVKAQGPHWMSVEGMPVATQINTRKGEYLTLVEYPVDVTDNTLTITLGGGRKGTTLLNFVIINSTPSLAQTKQALTTSGMSLTMQVLAKSLGTDLIAAVVNSGTMTKVNPGQLVKQDNSRQKKLAKVEKKRQRVLAKIEKVRQRLLARIAKIEQILVKYADKPRVVARLNKKKANYYRVIARFQAKYGIN